MTPDRWLKIKTAFLEAFSLPAPEQSRFLARLQQQDPDLAHAVRELLEDSPEDSLELRRSCWLNDPPPAEHLLAPGACLAARFEIIQFLGAGGAAEVYRAFDRQQQELVALKILRRECLPDHSALLLLRNELHTARRVTHTNVCRLHEFYPAAGNVGAFLTMELLNGQTLQQRLASDGPLAPHQAQPLITQIFDGLEAAHQHGVIHRDLKPGNIMLTEASRVVLMDFGLARDVQRAADLATTITQNRFAGTPAYMAPEQLKGEPATFASDLHALGVLLFELFTGTRPFDGASPVETAARRLHEQAPRPRVNGEFLERRWERVIQLCLSSDPKARPASVETVRQLLAVGAPLLWGRRNLIFGLSFSATACLGGVAWQNWADSSGIAAESQTAAFDHYVRGSKLLEEFTPVSVRAAIGEFERALQLHPRFALAMSGLADAHLYLKNVEPQKAAAHLTAAGRLATQAVQTEPILAEGHTSLAAVRQAEWRWREAELSYREALRLKPKAAKTHRWFCGLLLQFGRNEEAISHAQRALELDPYDRAAPASIGLYYFLAGQYQAALDILEPAVRELDSVGKSDSARFNLAQVYARMGYLAVGDAARNYFESSLRQAAIVKSFEAGRPGPSLAEALYALIHSLLGDLPQAEPYFARILADYAKGQVPALHVAWVYAVQHKLDEAVIVLERGLASHDPTLLYIKVVPFLENLRPHAGFQSILQRLAL